MKKWYLDTPTPNITGFESDTITEYAQSNFSDVLLTQFSNTVILYNSDLSISKQIQCIIEGNTADTQLQSMQRKGLFVRGTVKDGMYVFFDGGYWLIIGFTGTNGIYEKATMSLCQFKLRWQNSDGKIIERWSYTEDFTKYSNGLTGNSTLTIGDNQYGLTLPIDDETKKLKLDMRFHIDFDDSEQPDIYKLTNRKVKLNDNNSSGHGGTMIVTMSFDAFNKNDDKKVTMEDGQEVWICNYNDSHTTPLPPQLTESDEMADLCAAISGNTSLKNGYKRTYTVKFVDTDGNAIDWNDVNFSWNVVSDFDINKTVNENKITLSVNDEELIGSSFLLQIIVNNSVISEIGITVVELIG